MERQRLLVPTTASTREMVPVVRRSSRGLLERGVRHTPNALGQGRLTRLPALDGRRRSIPFGGSGSSLDRGCMYGPTRVEPASDPPLLSLVNKESWMGFYVYLAWD